jgi:hypothetical protein
MFILLIVLWFNNAYTQRHAALRLLHRTHCLHYNLVIASHIKIHAADDVCEHSDCLYHGKPPAHAISRAATERNERVAVMLALSLASEETFRPESVGVVEVVR